MKQPNRTTNRTVAAFMTAAVLALTTMVSGCVGVTGRPLIAADSRVPDAWRWQPAPGNYFVEPAGRLDTELIQVHSNDSAPGVAAGATSLRVGQPDVPGTVAGVRINDRHVIVEYRTAENSYIQLLLEEPSGRQAVFRMGTIDTSACTPEVLAALADAAGVKLKGDIPEAATIGGLRSFLATAINRGCVSWANGRVVRLPPDHARLLVERRNRTF